MTNKYDSTEFWYTFINSLYNQGLSSESGISEIDEETQEKLLVYFKEKIEEGVINGETALPPGLHDYLWRLPKKMLPQVRDLTDSFLQSDSKNAPAALLRTIVEISDWDAKNDPHIEDTFSLIPNDPGMSLVVINDFRLHHYFFADIEKVLISLENLYLWAIEQEDSARYQEAKSFYHQHRITPYIVYKTLKDKLQDFKNHLENSSDTKAISQKIDKCNSLIKKCRDFVPLENAAFRKNLGQQSEDQQDLLDTPSDNTDIWEVYLKSKENRKKAPPRRLTQNDQDQLLEYFKTKIRKGVVEGKTSLPAQLHEYISDFPEAMHLELREFAEDVLESEPENGAAAKILAIIVEEDEFPYLEQGIELLPNDIEICFFAIKRYNKPIHGNENTFFKLTLPTLEKLFARAQQKDGYELYHWLTKLYKENGKTPCHIYRKLMLHPDANSEQIERSKTLINQARTVFQQRLEECPDDWYALRGLGDIYQTLGETELSKQYPWAGHQDLSEVRWEQKAWEGLELPNFSATTLDGTPISFSDYLGKLVLLYFCAKWCVHCTPEIPYIKEIYKKHYDKGFEVIGVSLDENEAELRQYVEEHEIPWVQIFDGKRWESKLALYFGINFIPSLWLIDRDGKIISVSCRQDWLGQTVNWTESSRVGDMIPNFSAVDIEGNILSPTTFRGKVVLLYFGNPEEVLPYTNTLYRKYHEKGFDLIGVSVSGWKNEEVFRDRVREENFLGQHIYDSGGYDGPLARQFGINPWRPLPAMVLVDKDGNIIMSRYEDVHSQEAWVAMLEELVDKHLKV